MEETIGGGVKSFERMPTLESVPPDFFEVMPGFLARTALELGPVFRRRVPEPVRPFLGEWFVYMVGPEANRFVLQSHRAFFSHDLGWSPRLAGVFEKGLLNTDPPEHTWQRKLMNPAFTIAYMNAYLPIMNRVITQRTADWAARGEVDLYEETRKIAFDVAAEALVGFQTGAWVDRLRELFYDLLRVDQTALSETQEDYFARLACTRAEMDAMLLRMIAERRAHPTGDILGLLVQARDEDGVAFTDQQLLGQLHILLVAGHETTTTLSAWLLYLLSTHPDYLERVRAELDALPANPDGTATLGAIRAARVLGYAVDEAARLRSPVSNVPRGVLADVAFGGYTIPAGTQVLLSLVACHRLPHIFADPERFDPDRFAPPREEDKRHPYALVPFGGGPRICIGINVAQVEVKAMAMHILRAYTLEPVPDRPIVQTYYNLVASLPYGLHVRVRPLSPTPAPTGAWQGTGPYRG